MRIKEYGSICRRYRKERAKMTLQEMQTETGENAKNLSAYENGRANNIKYILFYYSILKTESDRNDFVTEIFHTL